MNRLLLPFLLLIAILAACGGNPPDAAPAPTEPAAVAEQPATPEPDPTEPPAVATSAPAATVPPPPTATNQAVAGPENTPESEQVDLNDSAESQLPDDIVETNPLDNIDIPTIYGDYVDELLGVRMQRPIDWTVHFPVRGEFSTYVSTAEIEADPLQSYASFTYQAIGRFEENGAPDLPTMLLGYLQQNVSAEITLDTIQPVELAGLPAALWRDGADFSDGVSQATQDWLIYSNPLIFHVKTRSQIGTDGIDYERELRTMLQSVRFDETSLLRGTLQFGRYEPYIADNLFYTSSNNGVAFSYPPGGFVSDAAGDIDIVSNEVLYDGFQGDEVGYAVYYRQLEPGSSAEPSLELAQSLIALPEISARQVDRNRVQIDRYSADAIMYRNRPDNRFTYELAVYVVNQGAGQAAIVSVKYGTAAPAIWNEGVIGSILYGP